MPTYETEMKGSGIKGARYEGQSTTTMPDPTLTLHARIERLEQATGTAIQSLEAKIKRLEAELQRLTGPIQHID